MLGALGTEQNRPSSAAQCVAYIALTEIPVGQWPNLIDRLVANVTTPGATDMTKESTLEAIGYICQVNVNSCDFTERLFCRQGKNLGSACRLGVVKGNKMVR